MCVGPLAPSKPKAPPPPPKTPEAPQTPEAPTARAEGDMKRRRAAAGAGRTSTILTGARGVQDGAATSSKTLLGQ